MLGKRREVRSRSRKKETQTSTTGTFSRRKLPDVLKKVPKGHGKRENPWNPASGYIPRSGAETTKKGGRIAARKASRRSPSGTDPYRRGGGRVSLSFKSVRRVSGGEGSSSKEHSRGEGDAVFEKNRGQLKEPLKEATQPQKGEYNREGRVVFKGPFHGKQT